MVMPGSDCIWAGREDDKAVAVNEKKEIDQ